MTKLLEQLKTIEIDGVKYYQCSVLGKVLGLVNVHTSLANMNKTYFRYINVETRIGMRKTQFITYDGLLSLIIASRKPKCSQLAIELGVNVLTRKYECKEAESLSAIMKAFQGENMIEQYNVDGYRIDLYFPDYKLSIECDENNHKDRNEIYEKRRQKAISKKLECQFFRYDPDSKDFNIFDTINRIFLIMKTKMINA